MYSDPDYIHDILVKARFNKFEDKLIDDLIKLTGQQKATAVREAALAYARYIIKCNKEKAEKEGYTKGLKA